MVTTEALCEASDYMLQGDTEKLKVWILDNIKTVGDLFLASLFEKEAEHPWWFLKDLCVLTYGLVMKVEKEDL